VERCLPKKRRREKGHCLACNACFENGKREIFNNKASTAFMLIVKIKEEVALWSLAGAKSLSNIMP
jgi:hypothetical protein